MTRHAPLPLFLLLFIIPSTMAQSDASQDLGGSFTATAATFQAQPGSVFGGMSSLHAYTQQGGLVEAVGFEGQARVNVTHSYWDSYLQSPNQPNSTTLGGLQNTDFTETPNSWVSLTARAWFHRANLLVVAESDAQLNVAGFNATVRPSTGAEYWAGDHVPGAQVVETYPTQVFGNHQWGRLDTLSLGPGSLEVRGNFTVWLWGINGTLDRSGEPSGPLASGLWAETGVTIGGRYDVQRTTHAQLVRLDARGAQLTLSGTGGNWRWTSDTAMVEATRMSLTHGYGTLLGSTATYDLEGDSATLSGDFAARLAPGSPIARRVDAESLALDRPGKARAPPAPSAAAEIAATTPSGPGISWVFLGIALVAVAATLAAALALRRRRAHAIRLLLERGKAALQENRLPAARKLAEAALRIDPYNSLALLVAGASLLRSGEAARAARLLEMAMDRAAAEVGGLSYLLVLCLRASGDHERVARWLPWIARDPRLWSALGEATSYDLLSQRVFEPAEPEIAYS